MEVFLVIVQWVAIIPGFLAAVLSILLFFRLQWPAPALWFLKLYVSALSPLFLLIGMFNTVVGLATGSVFISLIGIYSVLVFCIHVIIVTRPPGSFSNFEKAFGLHWEDKIIPGLKSHFLRSRMSLKLPVVLPPRMEQNIPFAIIPGTERRLLCDLWQPREDVPSSGLAFIYLHGSAWYFLDKDVGTRKLFSHLTAQGHVIMDVAYRLAPETDMMGMVHDVKRAITWMKEHANTYGVNPDKVAVGGGSAGAHLALLAAYTATNPQFTPMKLQGKDMNVCAVISFYGPADLEAMYYHSNQDQTTRSNPGRPKKAAPTQMPQWMIKKMGKDYYRLGINKAFENGETFVSIFGCHPDECPQTYALFSPVTHVHANCPPTLLIHGKHDTLAPEKSTRLLYNCLLEKNIQAVMHILPQTDHAFDLQLPKISPSAHNALYDVERFLALIV